MLWSEKYNICLSNLVKLKSYVSRKYILKWSTDTQNVYLITILKKLNLLIYYPHLNFISFIYFIYKAQ